MVRSERTAIAALVFACLVAGLMQTVVIPIQGQLPELLHAPRELTAWVVTVNAGGACAFSPISGRLGDLYGRKKVAVALMVVLAAGSAIGALTSNVVILVVGRGLQGIAIGVIPLSISIMRDAVSSRRLPGAVALASGMLGAGAAFGIPLGAVVTDRLDWHVLFWVCFAMGAASVAMLAWAVPATHEVRSGSFDLIGATGIVLGSAALLIAIAQGLDWGWLSLRLVATVAIGLLALVLANAYMARARSPLIDVRAAFGPRVLLTNSAALAVNFATMGSNVAFPQLMTLPRSTGAGLGIGTLGAALVMMTAGLSQMAATPLVTRWARSMGPRLLLIMGAAVIGVSMASAALFARTVWAVLVINVVVGLGFALAFSAFPLLIMGAVPRDQVGAVNGLNAQIRTFGTSAGAAMIGAVLAHWDAGGSPTQLAFRIALLACAAAGFAGCLVSAMIRHDPVSDPVEAVTTSV